MYFSAFQSHLWNLILARMIEHSTRPDQRISVALKAGLLPVSAAGLEPDQARALRDWPIPLPSSRNPLPEGPRGKVIDEVLRGLSTDLARFEGAASERRLLLQGITAGTRFP